MKVAWRFDDMAIIAPPPRPRKWPGSLIGNSHATSNRMAIWRFDYAAMQHNLNANTGYVNLNH